MATIALPTYLVIGVRPWESRCDFAIQDHLLDSLLIPEAGGVETRGLCEPD